MKRSYRDWDYGDDDGGDLDGDGDEVQTPSAREPDRLVPLLVYSPLDVSLICV